MAEQAYRVGLGEDIHALVDGRPLMLGGVEIAHDRGLQGHSDADALLHAITDAVLGAAGLGDIGEHFSDRDPRWSGADSALLLGQALQLVRAAGWQLVNVDATVRAQAPRLAPYRAAIRARVAAIVGLPVDAVNIKAKTAEGLGAIGRAEGIATSAVCLLQRRAET